MLYNGTPAARVKALETLFIKFDINGIKLLVFIFMRNCA